jgi:hypothetical protein
MWAIKECSSSIEQVFCVQTPIKFEAISCDRGRNDSTLVKLIFFGREVYLKFN